jgi:beta-glucanase (GH16 family)
MDSRGYTGGVRAALLLLTLVAAAGCDESPSRPGSDASRDLARDLGRPGDAPPERRPASEASAVDRAPLSPDSPPSPWKLVWSDEFSTPGLPDPTRWDYEVGFVRNSEAQYYTKARLENAHVENGKLTIEARKDNYQGHTITSASLITKGKASWTYGRIEVRAQIPTGKGSWPALWMLGTNIGEVGWPACGEIDIMENVGFEPDAIYGTVHLPGIDKGSKHQASAPYAGFHLYAIEWFADRIDFYYDTTKYFTYTKGAGSEAFDKPHYLLMNIAVGGSWGGQQGIDDAIFPLKMIIDYVRVYEHTP